MASHLHVYKRIATQQSIHRHRFRSWTTSVLLYVVKMKPLQVQKLFLASVLFFLQTTPSVAADLDMGLMRHICGSDPPHALKLLCKFFFGASCPNTSQFELGDWRYTGSGDGTGGAVGARAPTKCSPLS